MAWAFPLPLADWQNSKKPRIAPPLRLLARESLSFAYMRSAATFAGAVSLPVNGSGRHVMVLPGFMASDHTTTRLRRSLDAAGFVTHGWGLGRNRGIKADIFERIDAQLEKLAIDTPVILVGWSLGGVVAREYAKHAPHRVAKVVTLGSPFSGDPRANNAWRLYEFVAGHRVDAPPVAVTLAEKPPVPTCAFWSAGDGVVAPSAACGLPHESDEQIELGCSHMAFVAGPDAIRAIARAVAS
ncbi:MAG: alpha/beta hydrolase [Sphingorhabdus sp.]